jgi:hypothetical protein
LIPNAGNTISIDANASGLGYIPSHISKIVVINGTLSNSTGLYTNSTSSRNGSSTNGSSVIKSNMPSTTGVQSILKLFKINGIDTLPIFVLGTIAAGGVLVKKNSLFPHKTQPRTGIKSP